LKCRELPIDNLDAQVKEQDRRTLPRLSLHLPLQLSLSYTPKRVRASSVNIHHQGALIQADTEFPAGAELSIGLPDGWEEANRSEVDAEIRWKNTVNDGWQYGLKFKKSLDWSLTLNKNTLALRNYVLPSAIIMHSPEMIRQSCILRR